jgi:DHA1 family multidrug resistance protein-like MFS transporter
VRPGLGDKREGACGGGLPVHYTDAVQPAADSTLSPRAELRATLLIYLAGFTYHIGLGSTLILVPLYALHLGFDFAQLGIIIASQAVFGLLLRLFAGAISDRFGERWVLLFSFGTMVAGAAIIGVSGTFWTLILGQTFLGISRATYWTATQSYCSRINPARAGALLGRMSSSRTLGDMVGVFSAGIIAENMGYGWAWAVIVALGGVGLAGSLVLPMLPRKGALRGFKQALAPIPSMVRSPSMAMAGITAFVASTAMTIAVILLVPYLHELGNSEGDVGFVRGAGLVGSVGIGVVFGKIVSRTGQKNLYTLALSAMGVIMLAVPIMGTDSILGPPGLQAIFTPMGALMFMYGTFYGLLGPLYPLTAATYSSQEQRGVAMAYVGLYWGAAQVVIPASFGVLAASFGLRDSFWFAGVMFIVFAAAMPILFAYLTKSHGTTQQISR